MPFETRHPSWQSENPGLAKRDREKHHAKVDALPKAEMPLRASDVVAYLEETGRSRLVPGRDPNVDRLAYEEALINDLGEAEMHGDEEKTRRLRELILRGSLTVNKNDRPEAPMEAVMELMEDLTARQNELRRHSPDDAEEMEEHVQRIRDMRGALEHDIRDEEELQSVLETIEQEYRNALVKALRMPHRRERKRVRLDALPRIRLIRDALYMRALFPYMRERPRKRKPRAA